MKAHFSALGSSLEWNLMGMWMKTVQPRISIDKSEWILHSAKNCLKRSRMVMFFKTWSGILLIKYNAVKIAFPTNFWDSHGKYNCRSKLSNSLFFPSAVPFFLGVSRQVDWCQILFSLEILLKNRWSTMFHYQNIWCYPCVKMIFNHVIEHFKQFSDFRFLMHQKNPGWLCIIFNECHNPFFWDKVSTFEGLHTSLWMR